MSDWIYIIAILALSVMSLIIQGSVNNKFVEYNKPASSGCTGAEAVLRVLQQEGVTGVAVKTLNGTDALSNYYDPRENSISLSQAVEYGATISSIAVACHEAGHAIQYAKGYFPIKIRNAIIPMTNFCSRLSMPLLLVGLILSAFAYKAIYIAYVGLAFFAVAVFFQLITLPVEFDASRRALRGIQTCGLLSPEEMPGAKTMLRIAAMTYVAALAMSILQLLRFLNMVNRKR